MILQPSPSPAHAIGGAAWLHGLPRLLKFLGGKRRTEDLGPGSFPGHNPDGTPIEDMEDPYRYANFSTQPQQATAPGIWDRIKGGLPNPWPGIGGGGGGGQTQSGGGGIGSQIWKGLNSDFGQTALGVGAQLIGSKMASNQANKANEVNKENSDRSYQMAMEEKKRRDMLTRMLMPQLVRDMGVNNQDTAQRLIGGF